MEMPHAAGVELPGEFGGQGRGDQLARGGEIVELDTADTLYRHATHPYTRRLLGSFPSLSGSRGSFIRTGVHDGRLPTPEEIA